MYAFPQYQLAVLTKSPELGKAKTRMQPVLSKSFSLRLHSQLIDYVLQVWGHAEVCSLQLYLAGEESHFFKVFPQWRNLILHQQASGDLGKRLYGISNLVLKKYQGVILVGTDCPFIDAVYLSKACYALDQYDVVIGPATDGGYVLLGLKNNAKKIFSGIAWGSNSVFVETIKRIKELNFSYFILPELDDIDHPEDLAKLNAIPAFKDLLISINSDV